MITMYGPGERGLVQLEATAEEPVPTGAIWVDAIDPAPAEIMAIESAFDLELPTKEEVSEIEASSRLYVDEGGIFMTATVLSNADSVLPESSIVTFIITHNRLVTLRFSEPRPFRSFVAHAKRHALAVQSGETAFAGLLEAIVDRLADILEFVASDVDDISRSIMADHGDGPIQDSRKILKRISRNGDLVSKARESLVSIGRVIAFAMATLRGKGQKSIQVRLKTISRDVVSLTDHASFLANKVSFALDATLGMINIDQSGIIKIFSVVAVVFMPPTLIASIYGMNFDIMPELHWPWGYPFALFLMVASAVLHFAYFKWRRWL